MIKIKELKGLYVEIRPIDKNGLERSIPPLGSMQMAIDLSEYKEEFIAIKASIVDKKLSGAPMILSNHGSYYFKYYTAVDAVDAIKRGAVLKFQYHSNYTKEKYIKENNDKC